ncbi:MAG: helix-turn-helix domain-containing protein [Thermoplasmatota archaeon]
MFGLKRFTMRTTYHPSLRENVERLFQNIDSITLVEQFTTSPKEFLVLCEIRWRKVSDDLQGMFDVLVREVEWFDEVISIDTQGNRTLCFVKGHYEPGYTDLLLFTTKEFLCFIEFPILTTKENGTFTLVGPPGEVTKLLEFMKDFGSDMEIVGITEYNPKDRGVLSILTEKQLTALKHAHSSGFFDHPRKRDARDIAKDLGIRHTTFLTHLRRGQNRIFSYLFQE